jgi:hypothetical protein
VSETKFTPGPWGLDASVQFITVGPEDGFPVAEITVDTDEYGKDEHWANAHLIAAAPSLYAACERIVQEDANGEISIGAIEDCIFALKKARGEQ